MCETKFPRQQKNVYEEEASTSRWLSTVQIFLSLSSGLETGWRYLHGHTIKKLIISITTSLDFRSTAHTFNINNKKRSVLWSYS